MDGTGRVRSRLDTANDSHRNLDNRSSDSAEPGLAAAVVMATANVSYLVTPRYWLVQQVVGLILAPAKMAGILIANKIMMTTAAPRQQQFCRYRNLLVVAESISNPGHQSLDP